MIKAGEELLKLQAENKKLGAKVYNLSAKIIGLEQDKIELQEENARLRQSLKEIMSVQNVNFVLPMKDIDLEMFKALMSQAELQVIPPTEDIVFSDELFIEPKDHLQRT